MLSFDCYEAQLAEADSKQEVEAISSLKRKASKLNTLSKKVRFKDKKEVENPCAKIVKCFIKDIKYNEIFVEKMFACLCAF